jgi:hypothetical protein
VELVSELGAGPADDGTSPEPSVIEDADQAALAASVGRGMGVDPASAGLGTLALVAALSVGVTLLRRHRAQRVLRRRIVARLEAIGGHDTGPGTEPSAAMARAEAVPAPLDTFEARILRPDPPG